MCPENRVTYVSGRTTHYPTPKNSHALSIVKTGGDRTCHTSQRPTATQDLVTQNRSEAPFGWVPPGFLLPALAHVGGVQLQVSDLRRSIEYYELLLGLTAETRPDGTVGLAHGTPERTL